MHKLELLYQNAHFQWRGPVRPGPEVVIVAIDEKSVDGLGRWPWPRETVARLVEKLVDLQVKVIGFDMVFSSEYENPLRQKLINLSGEISAVENLRIKSALDQLILESSDEKFASVLRKSKRVVLGYFFHFRPEGLEHLSKKSLRDSFQSIKRSQFSGFIQPKGKIDFSSMNFPRAYAVEGNIPVLAENVKSAGFISFDVEADGSIRKLPLVVRYGAEIYGEDLFFPPLSIRVLEKYLEGSFIVRVGRMGIERVVLDIDEPFVIPTDERGALGINFLGKGGSFPHYSAIDILLDRVDLVSEQNLRGKIVLIGATAAGLEDLRPTPFDPVLPGVELHATVIDNILRKNSLSQPPWTPVADVVYLLTLGLFLTFFYSRLKPVYGVAVWLGVNFVTFAASHWIFINQGYWLTDIFPLVENTLLISSMMIYRYRTEERKRRYIQDIFGRYLSPSVIHLLMKDPGKLELGGEQKELTALFSDLQGFSTFSENLSPKDLVSLINTYLTAMTDILLKHEGTLDKYDGDGIRAFFGAPVFFDDHARRACLVCVEMQEKLAEIRKQLIMDGKPQLFMRIGIHSGFMVVGNMGSKVRMDYTMMGDTVNLAARLEGVNKAYGTFSMISEFTYLKAKDFIEARELDSVRVVGRSEPVTIYELLGKTGSLDDVIRKVLPLYREGLEHYKSRRWTLAMACFENALQVRPEDGPSSTMLERCAFFKVNSPPDDWDGVYSLKSK